MNESVRLKNIEQCFAAKNSIRVLTHKCEIGYMLEDINTTNLKHMIIVCYQHCKDVLKNKDPKGLCYEMRALACMTSEASNASPCLHGM